MKFRTMAMAAAALGLAAGSAWAQTTAGGRPVAGAPTAGSGTPRAGTGIPNAQLGETSQNTRRAGVGQAVEAQAPAAGQVGAAGGAAPAGAAGAMNDALFAAAAAGSGLCEVATGRLAVERGTGPVKALGQQMIADHTRANQELMTLASQRGLTLPRTLPITAQAEEVALAGVSGAEFDRCYLKQQLAAHIQSIGLFEAEAQRGQDPQVKAWAAQTLPALKQHFQHIKAMHDQMDGKAGSGAHQGQ